MTTARKAAKDESALGRAEVKPVDLKMQSVDLKS